MIETFLKPEVAVFYIFKNFSYLHAQISKEFSFFNTLSPAVQIKVIFHII